MARINVLTSAALVLALLVGTHGAFVSQQFVNPFTSRPALFSNRVASPYLTTGAHATVQNPIGLTSRATTVTVTRRGDSGSLAGATDFITSAYSYKSKNVVSAVRDSGGRTKLISWRVGDGGAITRVADSGPTGDVASVIDIAIVGDDIVTAISDPKANIGLTLISYRETGSGANGITRRGSSGTQAGYTEMFNIVNIAPNMFVTPCRTTPGDLKLITWRLNADGSFTRLADSGSAAGFVYEIDSASLEYPYQNMVMTTVRDGGGNIKLLLWHCNSDTGAITRVADSGSQAGSSRLIRSAVLDGRVYTSLKSGGDYLMVITWDVIWSGSAFSIKRVGDSGSQAGFIDDNSLVASYNSDSGVGLTSSVRTAEGTLKLITWSVASSGAITRTGDSGSQAGTASFIQTDYILNAAAPIVTTCRTAENTLKLISWNLS